MTLFTPPMNSDSSGTDQGAMAQVLERNIEALLVKRAEEEKRKSRQERLAAGIGRFTGSLRFVYLHVLFFGLWIAVNLGWTPFKPFDPTFVILAMAASVEAIFLSTFVLITQNLMQAQADRRADLNLQINLLAEHEVTHLIHMVEAIGQRLGTEPLSSEKTEELKQDVAPERVLDRIEAAESQLAGEDGERR